MPTKKSQSQLPPRGAAPPRISRQLSPASLEESPWLPIVSRSMPPTLETLPGYSIRDPGPPLRPSFPRRCPLLACREDVSPRSPPHCIGLPDRDGDPFASSKSAAPHLCRAPHRAPLLTTLDSRNRHPHYPSRPEGRSVMPQNLCPRAASRLVPGPKPWYRRERPHA